MVEDAPKNSSGRSESRLTPPGTLRSLGDEASKSALRAIQAAQAQFLGGSELDDAALPLLDWCRTGAVCDFAALIRLDPTDERSDRLAVTTVPEMLDQPGMIDSGEQGAGSLRGLDPSALRHSLTLGDQVRAPWITNHTHAAAVAPIARCLGDCRELAVYPLSSPDGISGAICLTRRSEPFQPDDLRSLEPVIDQLHLMVRATSAERTAQSSERVHEHARTRIEGIIAAVRLCTW